MVLSADATGSMSCQSGRSDAIFVVQDICGLRLSLDISSPVASMSNSCATDSEFEVYSAKREGAHLGVGSD